MRQRKDLAIAVIEDLENAGAPASVVELARDLASTVAVHQLHEERAAAKCAETLALILGRWLNSHPD